MGAVDNARQVGGRQHDKREGGDNVGHAGDGRHNKRKGVDHAR